MMWREHTRLARLFAVGLAVVFVGTLSLSLFNMSAQMNTNGHMSGCVFMSHDQALCSMDVFDHLAAWQSTFTAVLPAIVLLTLVVAVSFLGSLASAFAQLRSVHVVVPQGTMRERLRAFVSRPLQDLFSQGILHPKLF